MWAHEILCLLVFCLINPDCIPFPAGWESEGGVDCCRFVGQNELLNSDNGFEPAKSREYHNSQKMTVTFRDFDVCSPDSDGIIRTFGKNLRPSEIFEEGIFELSLQKGEDTRIIFGEGFCPMSPFQGYELNIYNGNISLTSKSSAITGNGSGTEVPVNFTRVDTERTVNIQIAHFNEYIPAQNQKRSVEFLASKTKVIVNNEILCEFEDSHMAGGFLHIVGGNFLKIHFKGFVKNPDPVYMPTYLMPVIY